MSLIWSKEDAAYIASIPEMPGCKADGSTPPEALANLYVVSKQWIETAKELGRPIPKPLSVEDYEELQKKFNRGLEGHIQKEVIAQWSVQAAPASRPRRRGPPPIIFGPFHP